ncbi:MULTISPECIES: hypothetical protein [unclassified Methanosarcina]|uniref:hypothetical protein n=1 Tax=unclassified Methanosarcina TaxID=2644672 RepID=UPI000615B5F9|nr:MULTISPECIES: hypothetical protein [unclassified Methanosarcina]AKB19216.1 hypothetical protein MSWHS_2353 [Methanosarcina sp. WWM596]AKB22954.1 hypothetical protein MSWH1_2683 [Methanosarcina sp. WH1]
MKQRMRLFIAFLLVFEIVMPALAEPSPFPPGYGDSIGFFCARHMNMEGNQEIMDFINTCGISDFQEVDVNRTHTYVYIIPKENCSNKLVFLERSGEIIWVRQIGMNEYTFRTTLDNGTDEANVSIPLHCWSTAIIVIDWENRYPITTMVKIETGKDRNSLRR